MKPHHEATTTSWQAHGALLAHNRLGCFCDEIYVGAKRIEIAGGCPLSQFEES
jgi:hypothetical protein